jgi:hypothetical protein
VLLWKELLYSQNEKIRLETLKYLTDRRDGKAPQSVFGVPERATGPVEITFDFHRPLNSIDERFIATSRS